MMNKYKVVFLACLWLALAGGAAAQKVQRGENYAVLELDFRGPQQTPRDAPARDIDFWVRLQHESGAPAYKIHGFWDGDGKGGATGNVFKVRFTPTKTGRWKLVEVFSNAPELHQQKQGEEVASTPSKQRGFWIVDAESAGQRWYKRSDGSHAYIIGNTQYSFLSGYKEGDAPVGVSIADDVRRNAEYFKKLRFSLHGDRYPHPQEKPYFDDEGRPTDWGDYAHRPNPKWFHERGDVAVRTAYEADLIADLILAGPDVEQARATLRARHNKGDATPYLKYIAARYGSFPNVWLCLANEHDIKQLVFPAADIARFGQTMRALLPYPTPLSVHSSSRALWPATFDALPPWNDHQIIQRKIRELPIAADVMNSIWKNADGKSPRLKPTVNDELSYEGAGDKHSAGDTIESHLGTFLGGGYGSTGYKSGFKLGHYFGGGFNPAEHTAADNLKWLREMIDAHVTFWKLTPEQSIFTNLHADFRGLAWAGQEYVLGTNKAHAGIVAQLPPGRWTVTQYDVVARKATPLNERATGRFSFDAPASRAVFTHFKKR